MSQPELTEDDMSTTIEIPRAPRDPRDHAASELTPADYRAHRDRLGLEVTALRNAVDTMESLARSLRPHSAANAYEAERAIESAIPAVRRRLAEAERLHSIAQDMLDEAEGLSPGRPRGPGAPERGDAAEIRLLGRGDWIPGYQVVDYVQLGVKVTSCADGTVHVLDARDVRRRVG